MRIGVDWGGTKIEVAVLADDGSIKWRKREPTPQDDYDGCIRLVCDLVLQGEKDTAGDATVGLGIPGAISQATGLVKNANAQWLNGRPLGQDIAAVLGRPVRIANDANCLALSEAVDGAGKGATTVFGVIIGTGVGGGIAVNGRPLEGRSRIAGEWGHTPLTRYDDDPAAPDPTCWRGRKRCMEAYISGPAFSRDYEAVTGIKLTAELIVERMRDGESDATQCFERYVGAFARGLATVINILDPDVIVLGGGMSNISELYDAIPKSISDQIFTDDFDTPIKPAVHGDSSGVRGAAWLWE